MKDLLTKNEARILQTVNPFEGSFLYELASAAALTPADALDAAERLDGRGYLALDRGKRFIKITRNGLSVKQDISESSLDDPQLSIKRSYAIVPNDMAELSSYHQMSESDVSEAIDVELERYDE